MKALDYSVARPSPAKLYAAGFRAVGRYLTDGTCQGCVKGKALTRAELAGLQAAGLQVWLNFEESGSFGGGWSTGVRDANIALRATSALGHLEAMVYFSCEHSATFDPRYLDGAVSVLGRRLVGAYVNAGPRSDVVIGRGYALWQAGGSSPHPKASIWQKLLGQPFDGQPDAIDIDETLVQDFGQIKGGVDMGSADDFFDVLAQQKATNKYQWAANQNYLNGWRAAGAGEPPTPEQKADKNFMAGWDDHARLGTGGGGGVPLKINLTGTATP